MAIKRKNFAEAYKHQSSISSIFQKIFIQTTALESMWFYPALHIVVVDLRLIAKKADKESRSVTPGESKLMAVANLLNSLFTTAVQDKTSPLSSKKLAALSFANGLCTIYFQTNTLSPAVIASQLQTVQGNDFPDLSNFSISQHATFKFYLSKNLMYSRNYRRAQEELLTAFNLCKNSTKNRRSLPILLEIDISAHETP
eukprot:TRINITY_DN6615_c0_g1_i2.p1 TRINITY_DN6615_c0_g1~~TRINITY_DN6615_c0_g1_i2.p1  ORF type:complete len:199 (+),score=22.09 TRINITY_DN6615_c0_g1_i2:364-960(+)